VVVLLVEKAPCGFESGGIEGGGELAGKEGVEVREDGVGGVVRGTTGTVFKREVFGEIGVEGFKVVSSGGAFDAAEGVEGVGVGGGSGHGGEPCGGFGGLGTVGCEALEDAAHVEDFGVDEDAGSSEASGRVAVGVELGGEGGGVAVCGMGDADGGAVGGLKGDRDAAGEEFAEGGGGEGDGVGDEDALDFGERDVALAGVGGTGGVGVGREVDFEVFGGEGGVGAGGGDVEGGHGVVVVIWFCGEW
jgi:hypothetical protein